MKAPDTELRSRNLRMLAALAGLFLLPLVAAFWMYYATDWRPAGRVNHGELILPVRQLPATGQLFRGKWSLVYLGEGQCGEECRRSLYVMRQTHVALNQDMKRVERVFLVTSSCCDREFLSSQHPGLQVVDATSSSMESLLRIFPAGQRTESLFIVDPLGNLMMRFDVRQDPKGLLTDLKKLLTLSHIG